jgi:MFS family permease
VYLSTVDKPDTLPGANAGRWKLVSGNVVALGTVSLVTDVSSEMVTAILPVYLMIGLALSPLAYGVIDGLYTGATAVLRLVGGYVADRFRRRKAVAGLGYGMSAVTKLGLLAAGSSATAIGFVITADRTGKGLRTAPRDALITLSSPPQALGRAFGVHRAMDSMGAFAGPLVALAVLAAAGGAFDAVFVTSFCIALLGVLVLVLFVRDRREQLAVDQPKVSPKAALGLLRTGKLTRLVLAAACLGLATIGDGFVYLLLQRKQELSLGWFPLLAVGTSLAYLLLAAPLGMLADRVGRLPVVLGGYALLIAVYVLLAAPLRGLAYLVLVLGLYGTFYAATDGVLLALAGPVLPPGLRTTGIAVIQTSQAVAYFGSSVLFGLAWQLWGAQMAIMAAALAVLPAMVVTSALLRARTRNEDLA